LSKLPPRRELLAARRQNGRRSFTDEVIKQLRDSIQQRCSQMVLIQQDVAGLRQRPMPPAQPYATPHQSGLIHSYLYRVGVPSAVRALSSESTWSLSWTYRALDYALGSVMQPCTTASAEAPPLGSSQVDNAGAKTDNSSARSSRSDSTPQAGEFA